MVLKFTTNPMANLWGGYLTGVKYNHKNNKKVFKANVTEREHHTVMCLEK